MSVNDFSDGRLGSRMLMAGELVDGSRADREHYRLRTSRLDSTGFDSDGFGLIQLDSATQN